MFIGQKEIATHTERTKTNTTYVTFVDGSSDSMPTKLFKASCSPEALDATALRDLQLRAVAGDVLLVMFDWNLKLMDYDFLDTLIRLTLQEHTRAADEKMWGKPKADITMLDIDRVKHS